MGKKEILFSQLILIILILTLLVVRAYSFDTNVASIKKVELVSWTSYTNSKWNHYMQYSTCILKITTITRIACGDNNKKTNEFYSYFGGGGLLFLTAINSNQKWIQVISSHWKDDKCILDYIKIGSGKIPCRVMKK